MSQKKMKISLQDIVSLCKRRGFVYQTSKIYGGLANCYDYGPLGTELLQNIKKIWWQTFIHQRSNMVGLDSQIMLHPKTWEASGHVTSFVDPLVEDKVNHKRYRADHIIENWLKKKISKNNSKSKKGKLKNIVVEDFSTEEMGQFIQDHQILSPDGNELTQPKNFKLLFESSIGSVAGEKSKIYLRGETAQGIFTNFKQVMDTTRVSLPFGIGQMGKSFRNEITTGQFIFRTLELEQAEIEYFFDPEEEDWEKIFEQWKVDIHTFVTQKLNINEDNLRWRRHTDKERSFYSKETYDLDYFYPFGWSELWGLAYRTNYDLKTHIKHSGQKLEYFDHKKNKRIIPHVVEPAVGINRIFLMIITDAYYYDKSKDRVVLQLTPNLAPYKAAIFPLVKNKEKITSKAKAIFQELSQKYHVAYDERGNIGKRYLYQDEMGTPKCITVDYQTLEDETVTIRDRDTTEQIRVKVTELDQYLSNMLGL